MPITNDAVDINETLANATAEHARSGNIQSAFEILEDFVMTVDQHSERTWSGPIYWAHAKYLADAFEKVVRAAMQSPTWKGSKWTDSNTGAAQLDANIALGIRSTKPGRRQGAKTYSETALAALYWYLIRLGFKPERANSAICERLGCDRRTVQNASIEDGNEAYRYPELLSDESLKVAFEPYASHAAVILATRDSQSLGPKRKRLRK